MSLICSVRFNRDKNYIREWAISLPGSPMIVKDGEEYRALSDIENETGSMLVYLKDEIELLKSPGVYEFINNDM